MKYFLALALFVLNVANATEQFSFTPEPDWLASVVIPDANEAPLHEVRDGALYLHFGRQVKVPAAGDATYYYRYVIQITNQTGLDDQSQINVSFDPVYEHIEFHKLNIIRDGLIIDRLQSTRLRLLDQEDELDQQLYSGTRTANLLLDDLRVGDIIDYSYTTLGDNPVFDDVFNAEFKLQWGIPVSSLHMRLLWQKDKPLHSRITNSDWSIEHRKNDNGDEYLLRVKEVPPLQLEEDAPDWFNPYATIQFSEQSEWREIVDWGRGLFATATTSNAKIKGIADEIRQSAVDQDAQVAAALQFVQDNIRYVGIELGVNSHQASPAPEVLARRYGDCKDKTSLMITILHELGIDAYPALVNTYRKARVAHQLPSMHAFNHVLVALPKDDKIYWLDPTRSHQLGKLENIYQPNYGVALVLQPGAENLTAMTSDYSNSGFEISEHYNFISDEDGVVDLSVVTEYYGANAEWQIAKFQRDSIGEIAQSYLEFYQGYYPEMKSLRDPEFEVDPNSHRFRVKEFYRIEGFWQKADGDDRKSGWIYSWSINSYLDKPGKLSRNQAFDLGRPFEAKQTIKVSLEKGDWDFSEERFDENNDIFHYQKSENFAADDNIMYLEYRFTRKLDHVEVKDYPAYLAALERADEQTDFGFSRKLPDAEPDIDLNSLAIVSGMILYVIAIAAVILLWRRDLRRHPFTGEMKYYPVDGIKFVFLWIATFGLFPVYWFYRLWQFEKLRGANSHMLPPWRGFFYYLWFYPAHGAVGKHLREAKLTDAVPHRIEFVLLTLLLLAASFVPAIYDQFWLPALVVSPFIAFRLLWMVNLANGDDPAAQRYNSRWVPRHLLLLVICLPVYFFTLGSGLGYLPADGVISGDKVLGRDLKFMQRAGIIDPGDKVAWFYSDAFWSLRNDGNGISQRHVFSYWKDDNDRLQVELVDFNDIDDIKVYWSSGIHENTVVEVYRQDKTRLVLYLSSLDGQDKSFVNELKTRSKK
ncbi:MAG: DUF3857 and transglutaminase domain-containing protein [Gammaproteobacteria bacterium]|nr:DUF3857 and transglutaminase domain-containing protein [Gammaproteobacteria bacterium]